MATPQKEQERYPIVEVGRHPEPHEISGEMTGHIQVTPQTVTLTPDLQQAGVQAVGAAPLATSSPAIVLPLTADGIDRALHMRVADRVSEALYWLARWCVRMAAIAHEHGKRVLFGKQE